MIANSRRDAMKYSSTEYLVLYIQHLEYVSDPYIEGLGNLRGTDKKKVKFKTSGILW